MGWCGGGELMEKCVAAIQANVSDDEARYRIYVDMVNAFEEEDCDTLYECMGTDPAFDRAFKEVGNYEEEEYDPDEDF